MHGVWKSIVIGEFGTIDGLRAAVQSSGVIFDGDVEEMIGKSDFVLVQRPRKINLVRIAARELCGSGRPLEQIYDRIRRMELTLCPPEVGVKLRMEYTDQPNDELIFVGMKLIQLADGRRVFFIMDRSCSGKLLLRNIYGKPDHVYSGDLRDGAVRNWVFMYP